MASTLRSDPERAALDVRPIASLAEYRACAALQAEVWGADFECVPASVLQVSTYVGVRSRKKLMQYIRLRNKTCQPIQWAYSNPSHRIRAG